MKQWRLMKGKTQEQLALECGVHRNTYASWEENPEKITIENAKKVSKALGESIDDIFFTKETLQNVE
jgi:DNA-binding XRE family transcriptional regulator